MKKLLIRIWIYIKYPVQLKMDIKRILNSGKKRRLGLKSFPPNYLFFERFNERSIFIDVGSGFEAEFSVFMIENYQGTAYAVDPTEKHSKSLTEIEKLYFPKFKYIKAGLASVNGITTFFESVEHESGSLLSDHKNIRNDNINSYDVRTLNLPGLITEIGTNKVSMLKIDIEGMEYGLFNEENLNALDAVDQLFIEFHHISLKNYTSKDTKKIVKKITGKGFSAFSYDGLNYLFYR